MLQVNQVVKFANPNEDESANQTYFIIEIIEDKADIIPIGSGLEFPPVQTVLLSDLTDNIVDDLFQDYANIPSEVKAILDKYPLEDGDYNDLANCLTELQAIGYTYEYYLDGTPFNLHKI